MDIAVVAESGGEHPSFVIKGERGETGLPLDGRYRAVDADAVARQHLNGVRFLVCAFFFAQVEHGPVFARLRLDPGPDRKPDGLFAAGRDGEAQRTHHHPLVERLRRRRNQLDLILVVMGPGVDLDMQRHRRFFKIAHLDHLVDRLVADLQIIKGHRPDRKLGLQFGRGKGRPD